MIDLTKVKVGDLFSEESHYVVKKTSNIGILFTHLESGEEVQLNNGYIQNLLKSSDQFTKTVEVTREDSKDGSKLGIRSIFENIKSSEVFTVVFVKEGYKLNKKEFTEAKVVQKELALDYVNSVCDATARRESIIGAVADYIQNNPIKQVLDGELRTLRGYKVQFNSRDGKYNCVDVDLKMQNENSIRPVNINTIKELIVGGTKYIVK